MNIKLLIDNQFTDKDEGHCYAEIYDILFERIQHTAQNVLEIGIDKGGSILLWKNYFTNANIYGIDCNGEGCINQEILQHLKTDERVLLFTSLNAYDNLAIQMINAFSNHNFKISNPLFDVIIDDGPHTFDSQKKFIELYSPLLSEEGILIIEDIQDINYLEELMESVPDKLKKYVHVYDLRSAINQYDDVLFIIDKSYSKRSSSSLVLEVYGGRVIPMSTGKWIHCKYVQNWKPSEYVMPVFTTTQELVLDEMKSWARKKNPFSNL